MRDDPDDRRDSEDPENLDERVEELEARVRDLRDELGRPPEGPLGLPRPPTPREVLTFTGEYAIPTAVAVLEANLRALKALQRVIRLLDPERSVAADERDRLENRATDASRATLDRLESALEDVEETIRENDLPREGEARDILEDARRINREIRDRVERESGSADQRDPDRPRHDDLEGGTTIELTDERDEDRDDENADDEDNRDEDGDDGRGEVDVEAELRSIRDEIGDRDGEAGSSPADGSEESADGSEESAADATADSEAGPDSPEDDPSAPEDDPSAPEDDSSGDAA